MSCDVVYQFSITVIIISELLKLPSFIIYWLSTCGGILFHYKASLTSRVSDVSIYFIYFKFILQTIMCVNQWITSVLLLFNRRDWNLLIMRYCLNCASDRIQPGRFLKQMKDQLMVLLEKTSNYVLTYPRGVMRYVIKYVIDPVLCYRTEVN